jgi:hypothetical protein
MKIIGEMFGGLITVLKAIGVVFGVLITWLGLLAFAFAFVILGVEVAAWFKEGISPAAEVRELFSDTPTLTWIGMQKIFDWILELPMWVGVLVFGVGLTSLGTVMIFACDITSTLPPTLPPTFPPTPRETRFEHWLAVMLGFLA